MTLRRREFLRHIARAGGGAIVAPSLSGLAAWNFATPAQARAAVLGRDDLHHSVGYGPLVRSAESPEFRIPEAFRCVRISEGAMPSRVRPEFTVPNAFDGMASFAMPNGNIRLIRNHEMVDSAENGRAFGWPAYDGLASGGTTSLEVRLVGDGDDLRVELIDEFVSLAGTRVNCAGGPTPWGTWLTCEENTAGPTQGFERPHGYIFEVPADATSPVEPVPLRAMGRYVHEAVAVDPSTGIVYCTEDAWYAENNPRRIGCGLFRFIPDVPGQLAAGGRLQIMAIDQQPRLITARGRTPGDSWAAIWIDIEDPDPPAAETDPIAVFREGLAKGATIFARLEGAFHGDDGIYIVSTNGGDARAGQVFHYRPTADDRGTLTLVFESPSRDVLDSPDNICLSPRGGLVLCEDGSGEQYVRGLDRDGRIFDLVQHPEVEGRAGPGEFAGACFSPDGRVLFFNVQGGRYLNIPQPSATYAMWGPWAAGPL